MTDFNDPVSRYQLIDRVGPDEYNRQMKEWMDRSVVATVNGYRIRPVNSRFGRIFLIDGANVGFSTQAASEAHAATLPPGGE